MLTTEREKVNVVTLHEFSSLSRTASYYAGSLNDSGITKGMREIRWAHVTVSKQYREHAFRKPPSTTMDGGWIKGSFDPWQRSLFVPSVSSANTKEKGPLLAGKVIYVQKMEESHKSAEFSGENCFCKVLIAESCAAYYFKSLHFQSRIDGTI